MIAWLVEVLGVETFLPPNRAAHSKEVSFEVEIAGLQSEDLAGAEARHGCDGEHHAKRSLCRHDDRSRLLSSEASRFFGDGFLWKDDLSKV